MNKDDFKNITNSKTKPEFFGELYKKYADKVYSYFWYRVGHDKDLAEDLMQETFIRAFQHRKKFRIRKYSYLTYLLTIAHNLLIDYYRKPKAISIESVGEIPDEITIDQKYVEKESAGILWRAVQQLSDSEKSAILHFYQNGKKIKEIAQVMGKSENAVKLLLSRARKKLQNHPHLQNIANFVSPKRQQTRGRYIDKN